MEPIRDFTRVGHWGDSMDRTSATDRGHLRTIWCLPLAWRGPGSHE